MADFYFDDPIEESKGTRKNFRGVLALILLIVAGGTYLQTTLAANISLNSGRSVEFGQGVAMAAACSGANSLTVTPNSEFVNASGSGAHYLKSITVSGIPAECNGDDFQISAYDSTTSTALPMFASTKTVASIWNNGGNFQGGSGFLGSTITSSTGSFTVSFTTPVALASNVAKLTLQSTTHAAGNCATENICAVGDTGPGGGIVFYAGAAFTETGTVCNTRCNYLELAPKFWKSNPEPVGQLSPVSSYPSAATSDLFGAGWSNTNTLTAYANNTTGVYAAVRYGSATGTVGQWFLPSNYEMAALYNSPINTQLTEDWYWTSTYRGGFAGAEYYFPKNSGDIMPYFGAFAGAHSVRPIRAF
jgi:hypothetical protein